jgi:hypothetical protein
MDLKLWAELNMVGHVTYSEYLKMTPEEANACYAALQGVINESKRKRERESQLDTIAAQYRQQR